MKNKILLILLCFIIISNSAPGFGKVKLSPGIKFGINYSKFGSLKSYGVANILGIRNPDYDYPVGKVFGSFLELNFSDRLSLVNEFFYTNKILKLKSYKNNQLRLAQQITYHFIHIPFLMKIKSNQTFIPYFLLGLDFAYLVQAEYQYTYPVEDYYSGTHEITKQLPSVDTSIKTGIGEKIKLINDISLIVETFAIIGLKQFEYDVVGRWKNYSLQFNLGIQYK